MYPIPFWDTIEPGGWLPSFGKSGEKRRARDTAVSGVFEVPIVLYRLAEG